MAPYISMAKAQATLLSYHDQSFYGACAGPACTPTFEVSDENPDTSYHWAFPAVVSANGLFLKWSGVLTYCAFAAPWQKMTRLQASYPWIQELSRHCTCPGGHVVLRGRATALGLAMPWNQLASPYPWDLVEDGPE